MNKLKKLTLNDKDGRKCIVNWDNIACVVEVIDSNDNPYTEVFFVEGNAIGVEQSLDEVQSQIEHQIENC